MARLPSLPDLMSIIRDLQRDVKALQRATPLKSASVGEGGLRFYDGGSLTIEDGGGIVINGDGTIDVDGDATFGGDTAIGGNLAVTGTLSLPAGIINNNALANPVVTKVATNSASNYSLTTTGASKTVTTITVPSGFTQAQVMVSVDASIRNSTATYDYVYCSASVDGLSASQENINIVGANGGFAFVAGFHNVQMGGLGASITCSARLRSGFNPLPADASSGVTVNVAAIFTR